MKDWLRKVSVSLALAVCELLLGIALLAYPAGLASLVIIIVGVLLSVMGVLNIFSYMKLPREEAMKTWKLSSGSGLLLVGLVAICNQHWLVQILGTLTTLYALVILFSVFMKLQIAVDAYRGNRPYWYLMVVSTLCGLAVSILLFFHPLAENALWILTGIVLIAMAVIDVVYFWMGRRKKTAEKE